MILNLSLIIPAVAKNLLSRVNRVVIAVPLSRIAVGASAA